VDCASRSNRLPDRLPGSLGESAIQARDACATQVERAVLAPCTFNQQKWQTHSTHLQRHAAISGEEPDADWLFGRQQRGIGGGIQALPTESYGYPTSMEFTLPPLATVVFKSRR